MNLCNAAQTATCQKSQTPKLVKLRIPRPLLVSGRAESRRKEFLTQEDLDAFLKQGALVNRINRRMVSSISRLEDGQMYDYFPTKEPDIYGETSMSKAITAQKLLITCRIVISALLVLMATGIKVQVVDKIIDKKGKVRVMIYPSYIGHDLWTFADPAAYLAHAHQHTVRANRLEKDQQIVWSEVDNIEVVRPCDSVCRSFQSLDPRNFQHN